MQGLLRAFRPTLVVAVAGLLIAAASVANADDTAKNKQMYTDFVTNVINQGKVDMIDTYLASDFVEHETMPPGMAKGREGCTQFFTAYLKAFPDTKVTIDNMIAEGDMVCAIQTWTGTNKGEFMGMPATGKTVNYTVIDIVRMQDGKAVEHWGAWDQTKFMMELNPDMKMGAMGMGETMQKGMTKETGTEKTPKQTTN